MHFFNSLGILWTIFLTVWSSLSTHFFFRGQLPSFLLAMQVDEIDLTVNHLNGPLPDMSNLIGITKLDFSYNSLVVYPESHLCFNEIYFSCFFSIYISFAFKSCCMLLKAVIILVLVFFQTGTLGYMPSSLLYLGLQNNLFTGSIPQGKAVRVLNT